jgi:hypothetical protein
MLLVLDPDTRFLVRLAAVVEDRPDPDAQRLRDLPVRSGLDRVYFRAEPVVIQVTVAHGTATA